MGVTSCISRVWINNLISKLSQFFQYAKTHTGHIMRSPGETDPAVSALGQRLAVEITDQLRMMTQLYPPSGQDPTRLGCQPPELI
jgi:hypothetical protein